MSLSIALFERQPQSIAVCYLFLLSPSQNTPSCYLVSSALTLKALKGKTAEGGKATVVSITISWRRFFSFFFYFLYLHNTRCGFYFWSLSSSFRRMSCACTHRKILLAITPRNAGGISPRAGSRGNLILLSFSAMRKKVSKERIADTALSASSCSIPIVLTLILYFLPSFSAIWLFHHHILC